MVSQKSKIVPMAPEEREQRKIYFYAFVQGVFEASDKLRGSLVELSPEDVLKVIKEELEAIMK